MSVFFFVVCLVFLLVFSILESCNLSSILPRQRAGVGAAEKSSLPRLPGAEARGCAGIAARSAARRH